MVLVTSNIACIVHLYFLLETFIFSPVGISITYEFQNEFILPRIQICSQTSRLLNPDILDKSNVTRERLYAIELGLGYINDHEQDLYKTLNLTRVSSEYDHLIMEYGNVVDAAVDFYG